MSDVKKCEFTCEICRDLIPLVKDGVASADSEAAVKRHIENCGECSEYAALFDEKTASQPPKISEMSEIVPNRVFLRAKRWLTFVYAAVLLLGVFYTVRFTGSSEMFISWLLMPFIGVFGYLVFRWRMAYILPPLLLIPLLLLNENMLLNDGKQLENNFMLFWALLYYLTAVAGMIIAALLRFAFGRTSLEWGEKNER